MSKHVPILLSIHPILIYVSLVPIIVLHALYLLLTVPLVQQILFFTKDNAFLPALALFTLFKENVSPALINAFFVRHLFVHNAPKTISFNLTKSNALKRALQLTYLQSFKTKQIHLIIDASNATLIVVPAHFQFLIVRAAHQISFFSTLLAPEIALLLFSLI